MNPELSAALPMIAGDVSTLTGAQARSAAETTGIDLAQQLQAINDRLEKLEIFALISENMHTSRRNRDRDLFDKGYEPLRKTVPGDGFLLAQRVVAKFNLRAQHQIAPLHPTPAIGDKPSNFNGNILYYKDADTLKMVVFYNEDFGILANESDENMGSGTLTDNEDDEDDEDDEPGHMQRAFNFRTFLSFSPAR